MQPMILTGLDYAIIAVPLGIVLLASLYLRRYMTSVVDFLAANRCAGRYLIATAGAETSATVMSMIVGLEVFSRVGWSLEFWQSFVNLLFFFISMLGLVGYRFRQTRALTFHEFFEIRYSRSTRVFASFLYATSGVLAFGIQPAVGARFFVYFCGLPESIHLGASSIPTYIPLMAALMALSLYFALTGGQISVMVTDCLEGVLSSVFYLIIAGFIIYSLSISQVREAMLSGPAGASYVDPFDIGGRTDFNGWYVLIGATLSLSWFRGNAWNQGAAAAARTPHEGRMAAILGNWRGVTYTAMSALVALGAFTLIHHPAFVAQHAAIDSTVAGISVPELRSQLRMPVAIGVLLAPGIRGCFCSVLLFGLLAGQGQLLHNYGSTYLQDVCLPLLKKPLSPRAHLLGLKLTIVGVALFALLFSVWFKPVDYLVLAIQLLGTLYLGGIGMVVWGGLYWKRGTTAGAWTSMLIGSTLSILFFTIQQYWRPLQPWLMTLTGTHGAVRNYLSLHPDKCPLNGQQLSLIIVALCGTGYVVVSWLTANRDFDLNFLLHRGRYRVADDDAVSGPVASSRSWLARLLNIDEHFTRADKALTYATFGWTVFWQALSAALLLWMLLFGRFSAQWWFDYRMITSVGIALALAVPTNVWFTIGVARDIFRLLTVLNTASRDQTDDGTTPAHVNAQIAPAEGFEMDSKVTVQVVSPP